MVRRRPAGERGHTRVDWLDSWHTFSFADYHDPAQMGFRALRVINEDRIAPGRGFGTHSHQDMEIVTCVLSGTLQHRDSLGNGSSIQPGDVQRMSAGTGIAHSEFNPSETEPVHLLQIWILPAQRGLQPSYEQRHFAPELREGRLCLVGARDGREGAVTIHQDVDLYVATIPAGKRVAQRLRAGRHAWVQVASGEVLVDGEPLGAGDGAAVSDTDRLELAGTASAEVLIFDLA
jgi:hypothetical protein